MSEENKEEWLEMHHKERIAFFEKTVNKEIMFSVKLLHVYVENLKDQEKLKQNKNFDLLEEGFTDRLIALDKQIKKALQFITKK